MTTTLPTALANNLERNAERAGIPMNTILEDALRIYWGEVEPMLEGRRRLVMEASKMVPLKRAA